MTIARATKRPDIFTTLVIAGVVIVLLIHFLLIMPLRHRAAVSYVEQWAQENYDSLIAGDRPETDDELLVNAFYYAFVRPQTQAQVAAGDIWQDIPGVQGVDSEGSNSLVAIAVGMAEGTRIYTGGTTVHWESHTDPGNGVTNQGTFSYQHGAASPQEADRKQLARLKSQTAEILSYAESIGLEMNQEELLNAIDLANQAPLAALGAMGFPDRLLEVKQQGMSGMDAIVSARARSFIDPNTGRLNAPGLGNTMPGVMADQQRRATRVAEAISTYPDLNSEQKSTPELDTAGMLEKLESTGAMQALREGVYTTDDGWTSVKPEAVSTALWQLGVCDWSDRCDLVPPENSSPQDVAGAMAWEMGYAQGVLQPDAPLEPVQPEGIAAKFVDPVDMSISGMVFTSPYGWRQHPVLGGRRFHTGVDLAGPTGTVIVAAASGVVTQSGWISGFGQSMTLQHPDGTETFYAHNSGNLFPAGVEVKQGAPIAYVGNTGYSTGPHLHFEIHYPGQGHINPCKELQCTSYQRTFSRSFD